MSEYLLHKKIVKYLNEYYPSIPFRTDYSGVRMSIGLARKMKGLQHKILHSGFPDIFIPYPVGDYKGMFLEIKVKEYLGIYKVGVKKGEKRYHLGVVDEAQLRWKEVLEKLGYYVAIGYGESDCKNLINNYLRSSK